MRVQSLFNACCSLHDVISATEVTAGALLTPVINATPSTAVLLSMAAAYQTQGLIVDKYKESPSCNLRNTRQEIESV